MENQDSQPASIIYELMQVLRQASDALVGEQQLDDGFEVADTIRFEHSAIDWESRLPGNNFPIKIRTINRVLGLLHGNVIQHSHQVITLKNETHSYLVMTDSVVAITALQTRISLQGPAVIDDYLLRIWLHDISDRQVTATWFCAQDETFDGHCVRVGKNAIDIRSQADVMTLPFSHLVAVRILVDGNYQSQLDIK